MIRAQVFYRSVCVLVFIGLLTTWIFGPESLGGTKRYSHMLYYIQENPVKLENGTDDYVGQTMNDTSVGGRGGNDTRRISLAGIDQRFGPKSRDTCEDDGHREDTLSDTRTFDEWVNVFAEGKVKGKSLFRSNEYVFPWEEDYLSKPPLKDIMNLPDLTLSKVWFLLHGEIPISENLVIGKKYEKLSFRVDLVNGYGKQRPLGGDEIRAWISEDPSTESGQRFSASGYVEDIGNGSYVVTVTPLWTGLINLNIGIVYPREYIRAALHHARIGSHRFIFGLFKQQDLGVEEVTVCHATPNVPGRTCVCNFTSLNKVPFYCGRPLDKSLRCEDWTSVWPAFHPPFKDLNPPETEMVSQMARLADETLIKHRVVIRSMDNGEGPILPPCLKIDRATTWDKISPRGFWTNGSKWTSLICQEPEMTSEWVKQCLRSTEVWFIGDSNVSRMREELCSLVRCVYIPRYRKWPDHLLGRNEEYNITVNVRPHEHPLYLRRDWMPLYLNGGLSKYLSDLPSTGSHVIIIHYYLHLASSHLSALHYRLVALRDSLLDLFKRNPGVIVGIRGPHISTVQWATNHMFGGDVLANFMLKMFHDILKDVKNRVVLLDGWDMSIGIENNQFHPISAFPKAQLRSLLSFKCL